MALSIAYVTARKQPMLHWFFDSLALQLNGESIQVIVIDHWINDPGRKESVALLFEMALPNCELVHREPKPTPWSGRHRLCREDYFTAANSRNSAIALCQSEWLAIVDDLSVLMPEWLSAVKDAVRSNNYVACGSYRKVRGLKVEQGIAAFEETNDGLDHRLAMVNEDVAPCNGGWVFGCSIAFPVEAALSVGGFPEMCDSSGLGSEDYCFGIALKNRGHHLRYCRKMMTVESEEHHHNPDEPSFKRVNKGEGTTDKGHSALRIAQASTYFENYYEGGLRALRDYAVAHGEFPLVVEPRHDWYDGQAISEL